MPEFLNKEQIIESIKDVVTNAKSELIMIVPYVRMSDHIFKSLKKANEKGVEISLIYREESLKKPEMEKLCSLSNLNLLSHPDVHAKCYLNEEKMIITSMNLYDYSEKYNREMGVLIEKDEMFDDEVYSDAMQEVRSIIISAKLEKKSARSVKNGYYSKLIEPNWKKLIAPCKKINKYFDNKVFEVVEEGEYGLILCEDYYENMDIEIEPDYNKEINEDTGSFTLHRVLVDFKWQKPLAKKVNAIFRENYSEDMFDHFKVYWDWYGKSLALYRDRQRQPKWDELNEEQTIKKFKQGIELATSYIKKIEKSIR
jgi:hypothetical protein